MMIYMTFNEIGSDFSQCLVRLAEYFVHIRFRNLGRSFSPPEIAVRELHVFKAAPYIGFILD